MGLITKKHSIGKTIATLRKNKGWTQVELAEKLQVSDKAVSKWEKDDSAPSVEFFPALSELFGVSIDYLMTGKKEEQPFTLDDLDPIKRAVYLIEKDDISNFEKYGYVNGDVLLSETSINQRYSTRENKAIRQAVIEHQSIKIFDALATAFFEKLKQGQYNYLYIQSCASAAGLVWDYLDDFVKLCALSNHIDILDFIKFKFFGIGVVGPRKQFCRGKEMYSISQDTLDFIFTDQRVPQEIIDYVVQYEDETGKTPYTYGTYVGNYGTIVGSNAIRMTGNVLVSLYKSKRFDLLDEFMQNMRQEAQNTFDHLEINVRPSSFQLEFGYLFYTYETGYETHTCYCGRMVLAPTEFAIKQKDKAAALKFNEYNSFVKGLIDKLPVAKKELAVFVTDENGIDKAIEKVKAEERYQSIVSDDTMTEYDRRRKLFAIHKLSVSSAIEADDYDLFAQFPFEETKGLSISFVADHCKDIRFYIYAVGLGQSQDKLNAALDRVLQSDPERYDIIDVLLSAGAIIKDNPALTVVLKQNVLILNKQKDTVSAFDVEINNDETKQTLLNALNDGRLEYVIVNLTIQLEKKLKAKFGNGIQLLDMIDKAFEQELISDMERSMLHNLRKSRNTIVHQGEERGFYTTELIREWIEIVYKV